MQTAPTIRILLDSPGGHYQPGDPLSGRFFIEGTQMRSVRAAELSIVWYTAGKGEEDFAVHHFERHTDDAARPLDLRVPRRFTTKLPPSPLSYDGEIVKVCWCVRLRLFLPQIHETVAEIPFRLGNVAAGAQVAADEPEQPE